MKVRAGTEGFIKHHGYLGRYLGGFPSKGTGEGERKKERKNLPFLFFLFRSSKAAHCSILVRCSSCSSYKQ
jgi:hypothetical protein